MGSETASADGRRALGVRPVAPRSPIPEIHIAQDPAKAVTTSYDHDRSSKHRAIAASRGLSLAIPVNEDEPILGTTPESPSVSPRLARFRRATFAKPAPTVSGAGLQESQKLLAHLLDKLEARVKPPDLLARAAASAGAKTRHTADDGSRRAARIVEAVKVKTPASAVSMQGISSEDMAEKDDDGEWDADETTQLLAQIRDLLLLASKKHLDLFSPVKAVTSAPLDRPPKIKQRAGRLSSFVSPSSPDQGLLYQPGARDRITAPYELQTESRLRSRLIDIIGDTLKNESSFRIKRHRLMAPPLMLYSTALDVASLLFDSLDASGKADVLGSVIGSLYSARDVAKGKLLAWIEGRLFDPVVGRPRRRAPSLLRRPPGRPSAQPRSAPQQDFRDPFAAQSTPDVSSQLVPPLILTEPDDARPGDRPGLSPYVGTSHAFSSASANAPHTGSGQRLQFVTRALTAALSVIDICSAPLDTVYSFHRLFHRLMPEVDVAQNLLYIVGYGPPLARRQAMRLLSTYYQAAVGHNVIARRLPRMSYKAQRMRIETGQSQVLGEDEEEYHHYLPWRYEGNEDRCDVCHKHLSDFAVKCSLCGKGKHWSCSTGRDDSLISSGAGSTGSSHPVTIHFSLALPDQMELAQEGTMRRAISESGCHRLIDDHDLHLVNLVQLICCGICDLPLWGVTAQGYACLGDCQSVYHRDCLDKIGPCTAPSVKLARGIAPRPTAVDATHSQSSIESHIRTLCWSDNEIGQRSLDEFMVNYQQLWLQNSIIEHGKVSGTVSDQVAEWLKRADIPQYLLRMERRLSTQSGMSAGFADYTEITGQSVSTATAYLFDRHLLSYVLALCRNGATEHNANQNLLSVQWSGRPAQSDEETRDPSVLTIDKIRACLKQDFAIHDPRLADVLISQLHSIGLVDLHKCPDQPAIIIPNIIDNSAEVDPLLAAIESLLMDSDLALVEQGSRMLVQRRWPSPLASPEALHRIHLCVLEWIINESHIVDTVTIHSSSRHQRLPGVRLQHRAPTAPSGSAHLYRQTRQRIYKQHLQPWLHQLYELDSERYARTVYMVCMAVDQYADGAVAIDIVEKGLRAMNSLIDANATFGCTVDLIAVFLDACRDVKTDRPYSHLASIVGQHDLTAAGNDSLWAVMQELCNGSDDDFARLCRWARILSLSAVEVPWELLDVMTGRVRECAVGPASAEVMDDLATAVSNNTLHCEAQHVADITTSLLTALLGNDGVAADFTLRRLMRLIVHAYNVEVAEIEKTSFQTVAVPAIVCPVRIRLLQLDDSLIKGICDKPITDIPIMELCIDFLWLMLSHATSIGDLQRLVHLHSEALYRFVWPMMDHAIDRRCRTRLLFRLIAVDTRPLVSMLDRELTESSTRHDTLRRLLHLCLLMADDTVVAGSRAWRAAISPVVLAFLDACLDPNHPDSRQLLDLLLPSHCAAITVCLEDRLQKASDEDRLGILNCILRVHTAVPTWQVISWHVLDDLFVEMSATVNQLASGKSAQHRSALQETLAVLCLLACLTCDTLANGIKVTDTMAQRLQQHIAATCMRAIPFTENHNTADLYASLCRLLDSTALLPEKATSTHALIYASDGGDASSQDRPLKKPRLVGSLIAPIVMELVTLLKDNAAQHKRMILQMLLVLYYKHDCSAIELQASHALDTVAQCAIRIDQEAVLRLALAVIQSGLHRLERTGISRVAGSIWHAVATVLNGPGNAGWSGRAHDACLDILAALFRNFGSSGLVPQLLVTDDTLRAAKDAKTASVSHIAIDKLRQTPAHEAMAIDAETMMYTQCSALLRLEQDDLRAGLRALNRFAAAGEGDLPVEAIQGFDAFLHRLTKHIADWPADSFDTSSSLSLCTTILKRSNGIVIKPLISEIASFAHLCTIRFGVRWVDLQPLLDTCANIGRQAGLTDTIRRFTNDLTSGVLQGGHVHPASLAALLEALAADLLAERRSTLSLSRGSIEQMCTGALGILLRRHPNLQHPAKDPARLGQVCSSAAKLVLLANETSPGSYATGMLAVGFEVEAASNQLLAFIYLYTAVLSAKSDTGALQIFDTTLPIAARASALVLRALTDMLSMRDDAALARSIIMADEIRTFLRLVAIVPGAPHLSAVDAQTFQVFWRRVMPDWIRLLERSFEVTVSSTAFRRRLHGDFVDIVLLAAQSDADVFAQHTSAILRLLDRLGPLAGQPLIADGPASTRQQLLVDSIADARSALAGRGRCGGGCKGWKDMKGEILKELDAFEAGRVPRIMT